MQKMCFRKVYENGLLFLKDSSLVTKAYNVLTASKIGRDKLHRQLITPYLSGQQADMTRCDE